MNTTTRFRHRLSGASLRCLALTAVLTAGCGGTGEVSGTVSFDGQPLEAGRVTFYHPKLEGRNVSANIQPDGTFRVPYCPTGAVTATVQPMPRRLKPGEQPPPGTPARGRYAGNIPPVPARYNDPKTSDLVVKVSRGSQTVDLDLTP